MENKLSLQKGQIIYLESQSSIYKGTYQTQVLDITDRHLKVGMPYQDGRLVLLSIGTPLKIIISSSASFHSEVLERGFGPQPSLTLAIPWAFNSAARRTRVIAVTSGKGGVGKTNLVINLGIILAGLGQRVFIIDADLGTANIDVLLNLKVQYNLNDLADRGKEILELAVEGPGGINIIPGGSGLESLANLDDYQFHRVINSFKSLEQYADIILIDTGAGLSRNVMNFVLAADEVIVVTTPEPHAITDAYAILKVMDEQDPTLKTWLVVNKAETRLESEQVADRMINVANRFLHLKLTNLGHIPDDPSVPRAIKKLVPFALADPNSLPSRCLKQMAARLTQTGESTSPPFQQSRSFFDRFRDLFAKK